VWREQNEEECPLGEYDMRMCSVKEAKLPGKTNTFALITPKRNIYLQASTYKDMLMWMNAMNEAKVKVRGTFSFPFLSFYF
jgi:hypothetical protein